MNGFRENNSITMFPQKENQSLSEQKLNIVAVSGRIKKQPSAGTNRKQWFSWDN